MIGFFPSAYPDELLYSICARYSDAVQYAYKKAVNEELFGSRATAHISLPCRLDHLVAQLPPSSTYRVDRIIDNHTLLPFYSPFISPARVKVIRANMKGSNTVKAHVTSGVGASSIQPPLWLRFCPVCAEEDKKRWGEYYWHRLHQLPGINVCAEHLTLLVDSAVRARSKFDNDGYVSASQTIVPSRPTLLNPTNTLHSTLLEIASDATWLLCQRNLVPGFKVLYSCYLDLLASRDLVAVCGIPRCLALTKSFNRAYEPSLLKALQCDVDERKESVWIRNLLYDLTQDKIHHPLRHLLLIRFLGHTVESFFASYLPDKQVSFKPRKISSPFGRGPYPCLNPICKHFRSMSITSCRVIKQQHVTHADGTHPLLGIFNCACGFTYCQRKADLSKLKLFRFSFVQSYGGVWEATLAKLWDDNMISLRRIATTFGTNVHTVKRQAIRLGLTFPRPTTRVYPRGGKRAFLTNLNPKVQNHLKRKKKKMTEKRTANHRIWLYILRTVPKITQPWLRKNGYYGVYLWLLKNDKEWFSAHPFVHQRGIEPRRKIDWNERDRLTAKRVQYAILQLKDTTKRPMRITISAIALAIGDKAWLTKFYLGKLPMTFKLVSEALESIQQFALRRLHWAAECYRQEKVAPPRTTLIKRIGGGPTIWKDQPMKGIFESVWHALHDTQVSLNAEAA